MVIRAAANKLSNSLAQNPVEDIERGPGPVALMGEEGAGWQLAVGSWQENEN
jgi:hypothetical protein